LDTEDDPDREVFEPIGDPKNGKLLRRVEEGDPARELLL